ncbi:MAG: lactate utilization protein [Desulfovibrionaceae bacterium]|nr:lactate utilization protein [Desulfovibrionaceae bacterium]
MPEINQELVQIFVDKAKAVAATVVEKESIHDALNYVVEVCKAKAPAQLLAEENVPKGPLGPYGCPTRVKKILAAPDLDDADFQELASACEKEGIECINKGLRKHLAGIEVGLSYALVGVAASGTCLAVNDVEDVRLSGMISETHVLMLKKSQIYPDLPSIAPILRKCMEAGQGTYTTLITGPSRTADIERVGAIGVHGPLELHIILLEG